MEFGPPVVVTRDPRRYLPERVVDGTVLCPGKVLPYQLVYSFVRRVCPSDGQPTSTGGDIAQPSRPTPSPAKTCERAQRAGKAGPLCRQEVRPWPRE